MTDHPTGRRPTDHGDLLRAAQTLTAAVGALVTAVLLRAAAGLTAQTPVLAVTLALTLSRVPLTGTRQRLEAAVEVPLVALAAAGSGWLILHEPVVGQPLLVLGLSVGIAARRFGPAVRRAGRLVALPFLAVLITPVPPVPGRATVMILWSPVLALVALGWTVGTSVVAGRLRPSGSTITAEAEAADPSRARARGAGARRLDPPLRMALQMAIGLAAGLTAGHLLFGSRWEWTVLSAFLVQSGNRGRGDVLHKAGLRLVGAALGTALATSVASAVPQGRQSVLALLFAVMAAALVLRSRSYAWWAAGVTAMVALLHGYYGDSDTSLLTDRLLGVLVGSAVGVAAAWFVTPVRTGDVFRRRVADCLAALSDDLATDPAGGASAGGHAPARYPAAVARLDELVPTLSTHRQLHRRLVRQRRPHPMDAVVALRTLDPPGLDHRARQRLRRDVGRVRRAMVGRDNPTADQLVAPLGQVHEVLQATARRAAPARVAR